MTLRNFPEKSEIELAVLSSLKAGKLERKQIIDTTQNFYGYTAEQLKDRSCESINTRLKSITGVVINEMLSEEKIVCEDGVYGLPMPTVTDEAQSSKLTKTQKRRAQRKKAAEIKKQKPKYPDTPIGNMLLEADEKLEAYRNKNINEKTYDGHLKRIVIKCINEAGGEFFEELSMKLLIAVYGDTVKDNQLTAGADDNGIDGILTVTDPAGFSERIFFQSKTKLNERAYVSIKVAREFLGVMIAYGATKGILITNSNFHKDTRAFAAKCPNLMLIDANRLYEMMKQQSVGVLVNKEGTLVIDTEFFLSCK